VAADKDTFAGFVDLVASNLDEHGARAEELAARMYVSRSQLDRLVTAASGEAPGRFRRRILLERAAYRLLEGDRGVLDVAIEAGYSSNEAFTRAFRRAYGVAPSRWRIRPRSVHLDAPNGVHFHPPGGVRLPARTEVTSMDLLVTMTEHHIWLIGEMIDRASSLNDAQLDTPIDISVEGIDDNPTLRSLLSRLVGQMDMWNQAVANRPYDFTVEDHESIQSMRTRLVGCGPTFLGHVRDACQRGSLDDTFVDATGESPLFFTYGGMIAHVLMYAAYRRTLVVGALSTAGIMELQDDPLAWEPVRPAGPTAP
jgi:AraC family transcriptional regulator